MSEGKQTTRAEHEKQRAREVPTVQWVIAGISLAVVLGSFGLVAYEGLAGNSGPAVLSVAVDSIARDSTGHRVHVTVRNAGGNTAADVRVMAELTGATQPGASAVESTESGVIRFDFVPSGSQASGAFVFHADPRAGRLQLRVVGHTGR